MNTLNRALSLSLLCLLTLLHVGCGTLPFKQKKPSLPPSYGSSSWHNLVLQNVRSRTLRGFTYDATTRALIVVWKDGRVRRFLEVPNEIATKLSQASVPVAYFKGMIETAYASESLLVVEGHIYLSDNRIKVLPLGDSITQGHDPESCWRRYLWQGLTQAGQVVDFTGPYQVFIGNRKISATDFDMDHASLAGRPATYFTPKIEGFMEQYKVDVVLIHLGSNDFRLGASSEEALAEVQRIVRKIHAVNPLCEVLIARLIPYTYPVQKYADLVDGYNRALDAWFDLLATTSPRIHVVDLHTDFNPPTMTLDGSHPNGLGARWMAERWKKVLLPVLDGMKKVEDASNPAEPESVL